MQAKAQYSGLNYVKNIYTTFYLRIHYDFEIFVYKLHITVNHN